MHISLLGALEARGQDGTSITPSAAKPRQILALLACSPDQIVTVGALVEELWADRPVRSAATTVQTYVMQLRRLIAGALDGDPASAATRTKGLLTTCHRGYTLNVPRVAVDVVRFEQHAAAGVRALEVGHDLAGARLLREALALWRGPALVDVATGPRLALEVTRLEEHRLGVLEVCIDAELRLGRHAALLGELTVLCGRQPLHEGFAARYMLALHRSGRQSRALQVYAGLRRTLVDELAVEPSGPVRRLHARILAADPTLELPVLEGASRVAG